MPWWQNIHPEKTDEHPAETAAKHLPVKTKRPQWPRNIDLFQQSLKAVSSLQGEMPGKPIIRNNYFAYSAQESYFAV
jgi:hypothetical protein